MAERDDSGTGVGSISRMLSIAMAEVAVGVPELERQLAVVKEQLERTALDLRVARLAVTTTQANLEAECRAHLHTMAVSIDARDRAVCEERSACAKLADDHVTGDTDANWRECATRIAQAIRARGNGRG